MRDYATVSPQFWLGKTGRDLRKIGAEAQIVAFYLMTSPHANMLGLYYLPVLYLAHETGLGLEGASKGLKSAIEAGFCSYDEDTEVVWVHEMAAYQVGKQLKPGDNKCAGVRNGYATLPENPFLSLFYERYKNDFHLNLKRSYERGSGGASEGLRSQEQDQEQDQEQKPPSNPPRGKKAKNSFDPLIVELPEWISDELWKEWVEYRKQLGKPIKTQQGVTGALNKLAKFREQGYSPESVILEAMANEWQGLFEPKNSKVTYGQNIPRAGRTAASAVRAERERWEQQQDKRSGAERVEAVGDAGGDLWESLGDEEWVKTVNAMDRSDFEDDE